MYEQRWLAFVEQESLEALWEGFPEEARRELTQQVAQLLTRMRRAPRSEPEPTQEACDEPNHG